MCIYRDYQAEWRHVLIQPTKKAEKKKKIEVKGELASCLFFLYFSWTIAERNSTVSNDSVESLHDVHRNQIVTFVVAHNFHPIHCVYGVYCSISFDPHILHTWQIVNGVRRTTVWFMSLFNLRLNINIPYLYSFCYCWPFAVVVFS